MKLTSQMPSSTSPSRRLDRPAWHHARRFGPRLISLSSSLCASAKRRFHLGGMGAAKPKEDGGSPYGRIAPKTTGATDAGSRQQTSSQAEARAPKQVTLH